MQVTGEVKRILAEESIVSFSEIEAPGILAHYLENFAH